MQIIMARHTPGGMPTIGMLRGVCVASIRGMSKEINTAIIIGMARGVYIARIIGMARVVYIQNGARGCDGFP
jgi:hypothetical protein